MKQALESLRPRVMEIFEHLRAHPEISWREVETTAYLACLLRESGCRVTTFGDCTGVVGEIGAGELPLIVALRADLDALWQEVDGEFRANHSCGHDAHMTIVFGAWLLLKEVGFVPKGTLKLIFQPAEEKGTGALKMIEKKVVDDVDFLYGVHLRPATEMANRQAAAAIYNGSGQFISGKIIGADTHGARPHLGVNAIEVGAALVRELQRIRLNPMIPYSVKVTRFIAGGESHNVIPGNAEFSLDLRAQTNQAMDQLLAEVDRIIQAITALYDTQIDLSYHARVPAAEVDEQARKLLGEAIEDTLGVDQLVEPVVSPGGEDFHFYTIKRPQIKATMLGLGCGLEPGLHHPQMTFDREALLAGIEILARVVKRTFEQRGDG
ncbi:amidohydrolase [Ammoniphilus oxalaticus]|uniref:Amidohydrolase n=1 Tax=Ammoniphilus oxalaticus TaxID=66863 RepID=A0A419SKI5_9BACL|nr:M20 peptidase aminoacylase family protein [Ammoniphilus oxalaticus]RKD24460.1 amidohydrolase [Ammoniphilus oxalaticus]